DLIVRDGQPARQERRHAQELGLRLERGQELPEERDRVGRERQHHDGVAERARPGSHAVTVPARSRRRYAHATAMPSENTWRRTAEPKPSCRIWKSARYAYTVSGSVVPAGPPPVSTNMMSKARSASSVLNSTASSKMRPSSGKVIRVRVAMRPAPSTC